MELLYSCLKSTRKDVLQQYAQSLDMTQVYNEGFYTFYEALGQIDKESEYVQFISDNAKYVIIFDFRVKIVSYDIESCLVLKDLSLIIRY